MAVVEKVASAHASTRHRQPSVQSAGQGHHTFENRRTSWPIQGNAVQDTGTYMNSWKCQTRFSSVAWATRGNWELVSTVQSQSLTGSQEVSRRDPKEGKDQRRLTDRFRGDKVDVPLFESAKSCKFLAIFSVIKKETFPPFWRAVILMLYSNCSRSFAVTRKLLT